MKPYTTYLASIGVLTILVGAGFAADSKPTPGQTQPKSSTTEVANGNKIPVDAQANDMRGVIENTLKRTKGASIIRVGSGFAIAASGKASYALSSPNRNLRLNAVVKAYERAEQNAKWKIVRFIEGMDVDAKRDFDRSWFQAHGETSFAKTDLVTSNTMEARLEGVVRGVVTLSYQDDPVKKEVTVVLGNSPMTAGGGQFDAGGNVTLAEHLEAHVKAFENDLSKRPFSPIGGGSKVVSSDGKRLHRMYISYGIAAVSDFGDAELNANFLDEAIIVARSRAEAAMVSQILGEKLSRSKSLKEDESRAVTNFEQLEGSDPNAPKSKLVRLDQVKRDGAFGRETMVSEKLARVGKLPGGISESSGESDQGDYVWVALYWSRAARQLGNALKEAAASPGATYTPDSVPVTSSKAQADKTAQDGRKKGRVGGNSRPLEVLPPAKPTPLGDL